MTVVLGALRQHKYEFIDVYKEEASTALKAVVKQVNCLNWLLICVFNFIQYGRWLLPILIVWLSLTHIFWLLIIALPSFICVHFIK